MLDVQEGKALLVTGTDTGVGKTVVAGGLALGFRELGLNPGVFKPAESGVKDEPRDGLFLKRCGKPKESIREIVPFTLREPLAPGVAAEREGIIIDLQVIKEGLNLIRMKHPVTLVEGAGGLLVPLVGSFTYGDLARFLDLPILVVVRPSLGTINHTLLTVRMARAMGLKVLGIVVSGYPSDPSVAEKTNPQVIEALGNVRMLALIPKLAGVDTERGEMEGMTSYPWRDLAKRVWERLA